MDMDALIKILRAVHSGEINPEQALDRLKHLPFENIGTATVDHHRHLRTGIPEVVYAKDKSVDDVIQIANTIYERSGQVLITKASKELYESLSIKEAKFYPRSGIIMAGGAGEKKGLIVVITAGTSDIAVAEEAALTAEFLGSRVETIYDVGVAGIHRLTAHLEVLDRARVIVAVAGMEGALASVIGGLTGKIVIGVPTSAGYGVAFGGVASLLSMLNSCVPTVAVVNIDNGFGAGCIAHKINTL